MERKGKAIPRRGTKDRKGTGTNSGEFGVRNLEAESIRSRVQSTGGCVMTNVEDSHRDKMEQCA